MYPTLYHLLADLLGIHIEILKLVNTFGLLLALAFAAAARCLALELRRRAALGQIPPSFRPVVAKQKQTPLDVAISTTFVFLFSFKLLGVGLGEFSLNGGPDAQRYLLSTQGHLVGGLVCAAAWLGFQIYQLRNSASEEEAKPASASETREVSAEEHTMGITGAAAIGGIIGAKVFHWLETPADIIHMFTHFSMNALASGLTIYGALIVGAVAVYRYCKKHGLPFSAICDANAPGVMLGYAVGRLGCQLAGDGDWGIASTEPMPGWLSALPDWLWSYDYPNNVLSIGQPMAEGGFAGYGRHLVPPVYPTPLYESLAAFACFVLLWQLRTRLTRPFVLFGVYLMLNGFERFWIEKIRVNASYDFGFMQPTQAELISVALFFTGVVLVVTQARNAGWPSAERAT